MVPADASDVTAETTHVTSAEATHVTSTKAAHVAATEASAMSAASTASGLRTRGNKAAGEQRCCQNHHPSTFHISLHWDGRIFRRRTFVRCR
jgi:hypothetical protein